MSKKLTILDIAKFSGVGKSTVSRFFNNGYVSEEVREKIQKVIVEHGYAPNLFARGIKTKNNKFIGVIVPCFDSTTTSTILMNLDTKLREKGYIPLIINTNHNIELEKANLDNLWRLNVEGIIVLATQITPEHKNFIKRTQLPTLFVGQLCSNGYSIINNEVEAGKKIGNKILKANLKKILYIGVDEKDITVGITRREAIFKILKKSSDIELTEIKSDFSLEKTEILVDEYLKNNTPDCIISATDNMAFGAIKAIQKNKFKIPEDISVSGFGGYRISDMITPRLTTIKFNNERAGILAGESIIKLINGEDIPKIQKIDFEFLDRESIK
ncbi:LacI family DNA-binding transcriptional regulator [Fusobacterium sp.]|uniref:LacI family DNA-binding transcriptional regulator n=1 Tax=Fusobacterium sp. TaxID=68766 RepID=UPI0025BB6CF0|nr:LacI family DNA-binding transcriptional regulator [Fusobacterium sp.]